MQEKKDIIGHFFQRCRELEDRKGLNTVALCALIGLSRSHYYAIKNGEKPLSEKVWRKLEAAETKAGLNHVTRVEAPTISQPHVDDVSENQLYAELIAQLAALTTAITEQNKRIDALLEQREASSSGLGQVAKAKGKNLA